PSRDVVVEVAVEALETAVEIGSNGHEQQLDVDRLQSEGGRQESQPILEDRACLRGVGARARGGRAQQLVDVVLGDVQAAELAGAALARTPARDRGTDTVLQRVEPGERR